MSESGRPIAAPAGETCLKEVAAGSPVASFNSFTSCQPFSASKKLMYPGRPFNTVMGSSSPSISNFAGFWLGLQPYFSSNSFIGYALSLILCVRRYDKNKERQKDEFFFCLSFARNSFSAVFPCASLYCYLILW